MPESSPPLGRRERNKQAKLDRIIAAADELFFDHGVDDVTTAQIAAKADIGSGTLFLYAKSKGELLLMVQNSSYANSLVRGRTAAEKIPQTLEAVMAILTEVVHCNRKQVENGRTYLREMVFGDPEEPHRRAALELSQQTQEAIAAVLQRDQLIDSSHATTLARVISAIMFLTMASSVNATAGMEEIIQSIRGQVAAILPQ
ncbi:TetR/AcrR family transcriptional regulator [Arthrobacter sp. N199823]|uniref:TetR/AcrR family transcriptional regulator n=1 Tax=Arthrobacter sp. N199823 TaxID=2058895 RepID=UPI000CE31F22|nr:TetR/AcrR family transcriptional regulator [Arthrobacter sp. N199823]